MDERLKTTLGRIRRADQDFHLIDPGDADRHRGLRRQGQPVAGAWIVAVPQNPQRFHPQSAIMLTTGNAEPPDTICRGSVLRGRGYSADGAVYRSVSNPLFELRNDRSPCPLCAKMRRAMLCDISKELGCNKLALAHHRDDALETFLMSLIFEGRIHTFHPKTYMSRTDITVIRPMVYMPEKEVIHMQKKLDLPVLHNACPANGNTKRQEMKELLQELSKRYPHIQETMLSALQNDGQYSLWEKDGPRG